MKGYNIKLFFSNHKYSACKRNLQIRFKGKLETCKNVFSGSLLVYHLTHGVPTHLRPSPPKHSVGTLTTPLFLQLDHTLHHQNQKISYLDGDKAH